MAKGRLIPTTLNQSSRWGRLEEFDRYLFTYIIVHADDQGRMNAAPAFVKSVALPWSDASPQKVSEALQRLGEEGYITLYECDRDELLQINDWWDTQKLSWAQPSQLPAPDGWTDRVRYQTKGKIITKDWDMPGGFTSSADVTDNGEDADSESNDDLGSGEGSGLSSEEGSELGRGLGSGINQIKPNKLKPKNSSSSSSSEKGGKGGKTLNQTVGNEDEEEDDGILQTKNQKETLLALFGAAGIKRKKQQELLQPKIPFEIDDALSELAWCYENKKSPGNPGGVVGNPAIIAPMNLLKGDRQSATCYKAAYWDRHIPDPILERAGLAEYVQAKIGDNGHTRDDFEDDFDREDMQPVLVFDGPDKAKQAWETAQGQMQQTMERQPFETWVSPLEAVAFKDVEPVTTTNPVGEEVTTKSGVLTLVAGNVYACDWLESRLTSTINRLLSGMMRQKVEVEFITRDQYLGRIKTQ